MIKPVACVKCGALSWRVARLRYANLSGQWCHPCAEGKGWLCSQNAMRLHRGNGREALVVRNEWRGREAEANAPCEDATGGPHPDVLLGVALRLVDILAALGMTCEHIAFGSSVFL